MIGTLILDAGGVMVHPLHRYWDTPAKYREYLGAYADQVEGGAWRAATAKYRDILREDVLVDGVEDEFNRRTAFLRAVIDELGWDIPRDDFDALCRDFTYNPRRYCWYGDSDDFFARMRGKIRMGILSDAMPSVHSVFDEKNLHNIMDGIVISTELGCLKPDPRMYGAILEKLNVPAAECLFVDDKPENLRGAIACGMQAVQMDRGGVRPWEGDTVHSFAELIEYLEART